MAKGEVWNLYGHSYFYDLCILIMQSGNLLVWKCVICLKDGSTEATKLTAKKEEALILAQDMIKPKINHVEGCKPEEGGC